MKEYAIKTEHSNSYKIVFRFIQLILRIIFKTFYRVQILGKEKIPKKGAAILCSNHISYVDPVIIASIFPRYLYYMAKVELFKNSFLASIVTFLNTFPVKRESFDRKALRCTLDILEHNQVVGIFPEGTRSPDGIIKKAQGGVGMIAVMSKSPIIPVGISGTNKIIQKPRRRIFFPKVRVIFGDVIETGKIIEKFGSKLASQKIIEKTMDEIKRLYNIIN